MSDKRVLITGAAGFLGRNLVEYMNSVCRIIEVHGVDRAYGQTLQQTSLHRTYDAVIHLAADTQVWWCWKNPEKAMENNVSATLAAVRIAKQHNCPLIVSTTDKVYREGTEDADETSPLEGACPYSISKVLCEEVLCSARHFVNAPIVAVRCANIIGADDNNSGRLFPEIRSAYFGGSNMDFIARGNVRTWIHVSDVCEALVAILSAVLCGERVADAYNIGAEHSTVGAIIDSFADNGIVVGSNFSVPDYRENPRLTINSDRMKQQFGWHPRYTLTAAIEEIASVWRRQKCER